MIIYLVDLLFLFWRPRDECQSGHGCDNRRFPNRQGAISPISFVPFGNPSIDSIYQDDRTANHYIFSARA